MTTTATIRIRLSADIMEKLGRLANDSRRTSASFAAEAVSARVERELRIVECIKCGLDDVRSGRFVPHEQVVAEAREIIANAKRG